MPLVQKKLVKLGRHPGLKLLHHKMASTYQLLIDPNGSQMNYSAYLVACVLNAAKGRKY